MPVTVLNWIVPSTILLCGMAFIGIRRLGFATAQWGYALCVLAAGYALMLFETERFTPFKQLLEDSFILLSVILAARALRQRLDLKSSLPFEAAVMGLTGVMIVISHTVFKSVRFETLMVEAACACIVWAASLPFSYQAQKRADRILAVAFLLLAALLTSQSLLFIVAANVDQAVGSWRSSIWGNLVQFTGLIGSVAVTIGIMIATADDAAEKHRTDARTDPLTNLLNRRGLDALLASRCGTQLEAGPTAVIVADIDHFKSINDRFGHPFGDQVIKRFSALLQGSTGDPRCVVRLGGEEFLILLPTVSLREAVVIADRLRWKFARERVLSSSSAGCFTASFGVATLAPKPEAIADTIERADALLYAAKRSGRNCVVSEAGDFLSGATDTAAIPSHIRSLCIPDDAYGADGGQFPSTQTH
jgi:diguanylate cyclase (GGDEF)-like protein